MAKGDVWAAFVWSGDMVQLHADNKYLQVHLPKSGGGIWTDNMLIPKHGDAYPASAYMNFVYDPKIAARDRRLHQLHLPGVGRRQGAAEDRSRGVAKNPLIFPTPAMLAQLHQFDPKALFNADYKQKWQKLLGGLTAATPARRSLLHRHRWLTPYLLLAPGLVLLALFFLVPLGFLAHQSLETQNPIDFTNSFTWAWHNYSDALTAYDAQLIRSFEYAAIATAIALLLSYPLAYWIAFRGGRWKNLFLLMIIAPFFVTYLIRTLAWETILSDQGPVVTSPLRAPDQRDRRQRPPARDPDRGRRRDHLQLPALHGAAALRRARADRPEADRGGPGPVREQGAHLPARDAAAVDAGRARWHAAHVHPGGRRLHQRAAARHVEPVHDRERHPVEVPRAHRLPVGGGAVAAPDGGDPRARGGLRAGCSARRN